MDIEKLAGVDEKGVTTHKFLSPQEANQRKQKVKEMELGKKIIYMSKNLKKLPGGFKQKH